MRSFSIFLIFFVFGSAQAAEFTELRPQQSTLSFVSKQMGVPVEGDFKRFKATISIDPTKPESGKARIDIDLSSIDVGNKDGYIELIGKNWFDTTKYPTASFVSNKVTRTASGHFEVSGKMTMRDVTRDVKALFTLEQKTDVLMLDGAFQIKRLDYGVGTGTWGDTDTVADEVQIRFHFTVATKK